MFALWVIIILLLALGSCRTKVQYVPVESVRTEYSEKLLRDSIYHVDSVLVYSKGDTLTITKTRYKYRDRWHRDSVYVRDSIQVPYPVEVVKEVARPLQPLQKILMWIGGIVLGIGTIWGLLKIRL